MYPPNDRQFEDVSINSVKHNGEGWIITRSDGFSFCVPSDSPIEPQPGMLARFYGKGVGHRIRGLFLNEVCVFYRTAKDDDEQNEIELYGRDASDWLKRWDEGKTVWSIEMGGLGPGYEQCIQITAAEILRHLLSSNYDPEAWEDKEFWKQDREKIEQFGFKNEKIKSLGGITGAQWGAALSIAIHLFRDGPRAVMRDPSIKDRHIQVSQSFP